LAIAAVRPGVTAGEIATVIHRVLQESDMTAGFNGRLGHGIGLEQPEPPSIHSEDQTVLQAGMTLCIEPKGTITAGEDLVCEQQLVVTEEGAQVWSDRPAPELMVV
jgi:Xaa-Pro aminopeptidase